MTRATDSIYLRGLPADLKAGFKAYCAINGYTMEEAAEALIQECIEKPRGIRALVVIVRSSRRNKKRKNNRWNSENS